MRSPQHAARRNLRYGGAMPKITNIGTRRVVGAALRDLREQRGVTQTEVARRLGVSPSTVSVREAGNENGSLTVESLQAHLGALDAHLRLTVIDGVGDLEVVQATPALPPPLEQLAASWLQLDDGARSLVLAAADMALRTVRSGTGDTKKFA